MIKDIVVNLSVSEGGKATGDYAVSVASALDAHIAGIAFVYEPNTPMSELGYSPRGVMDVTTAIRRDNEAAAKAALDRFAAAAARADVQLSRGCSARVLITLGPNSAASRGASILQSSARLNPKGARSKQ